MKRKSAKIARKPFFIPLESVDIASPCHADWDAMTGDERSRFCPSCAKNVYNLSAMTRPEAELLLQEKEGRLCVRFFQREDGTMLTQDCPVGAAKWKEKSPAFVLWAGVASLLVLGGVLFSPGATAQPESNSPDDAVPTATTEATPTTVPTPPLPVMMGDVGPAPTASPTPAPTTAGVGVDGEMSVKPSSTPTATPDPKTTMTLGFVGIAPAKKPTPKPTPRPLMGRIASPKTTPAPTPPALTVKMGEAPAILGKPAVPQSPKNSKRNSKKSSPRAK